MKDFFRNKISLFTLFVFISFSAISQNGNPLQFLPEVSQSSRVNPAYQNKTDKLVFGLPLLSGFGLNWNANYAINNFSIINFSREGVSNDFQKFYDSLDGPGEAFTSAQAPLIYLSIRNKNRTFSFSIYERTFGSTHFDPEILNFYAKGLQPFYGKDDNIGSISIKANYFREIAFGYSAEIREGLNIGLRPKILFGKFFYHVDNVNLIVETIEEQDILRLRPEGKITISGPLKVVFDEENEYESVKPNLKGSDYFLKPKNMGVGIDIGLTYNLNMDTKISIAILDIGFTNFNYKIYDVIFDDALHYNKESLYQSHNPEAPNYWPPQYAANAMNDSIAYITDVIHVEKRRFEALPFQTNLELKHKLQNNLHIGFANHYTYYKNHSTNYLTGFISKTFNEKFNIAATLSLYNLEKIMPGVGASYTGKTVQFYFSTNNFAELVRPTSAKSINLSFGVNFLFSTN